MSALHIWFKSITPYVIISLLMTGCYHKSLERGTFNPADPDDYFAEILLVNGQRIKGFLMADTDLYIILSVKDLPEEIKQAQVIPLVVSEKQVTLYKKSGQPVSGRIMSIEDGLVEIKRADLRLGLKRLKHTFIEQDEIESVLPMGRPGEAQMTFMNDDIQSIKIKGPRQGEKEMAIVLFSALSMFVIGGLIIGKGLSDGLSSIGY